MLTKPWKIACSVAIFCAGISLVFLFLVEPSPSNTVVVDRPEPTTEINTPVPTTTKPTPGRVQTVRRHVQESQTVRHIWEINADRTLAVGSGSDRKPSENVTLQGKWIVEEGTTTDSAALKRVTLKDPIVRFGTAGQSPDQRVMQSLTADLSRPFFIRLAPQGQVEALVFDPNVCAEAAGWLAAITTSMDFVRHDGRTWTAEQFDTTGKYKAVYERKDGETVVRTRQGYLEAVADGQFADPSSLGRLNVDGTDEFQVHSDGVIRTCKSTTTTQVSPPGDAFTVSTRLNLVAHLVDQTRTADPVPAVVPEACDFLPPPLAVAGRKALFADTAITQRPPIDSLLGDLRDAESKDNPEQARINSMVQIADVLRENPEATPAVAEAIGSGLNGVAEDHLLASLGAAGTEQAQAVLVDVLADDETHADSKVAAAMYLGTAEHPSREATTALAQASESDDPELAQSAKLALGAVARKLGDGDQDADNAKDAVSLLLAQLKNAATPEQKTVLLAALGNSGAPESLDAIVAALYDESEWVRQAAAFSLRFIPGPEVDQWLVLAMTDPSEAVCSGALSAAAWRQPALLIDMVSEIARAHDEATLRSQALNVLGGWQKLSSLAADTLAWSQVNDVDADIRLLAQQILSNG